MSTIDEKLTLANENVPKVYAAGGAGIDLSNYVQKTDYATASKAGLVKVAADSGVMLEDEEGSICISAATEQDILAGLETCKPIVPATVNTAVKKGIGEQKKSIIELLDVVTHDDYAGQNKAGLVKIAIDLSQTAIEIDESNCITIIPANQGEVMGRLTNKPITPQNMNYAVKAALSDSQRISDMTVAEKTNARDVIGAVGLTDYATDTKAGVVKLGTGRNALMITGEGVISTAIPSESLIDQRNLSIASSLALNLGNLDYAVRSVRPEVSYNPPLTTSETYEVNTIYSLDSLSVINIALPSDAQCGDFIQVDFYTANVTTLTITSNAGISDVDLTPELNTAYSLYFDWGILYYDTSNSEYVNGWRFGYAAYPHEEV